MHKISRCDIVSSFYSIGKKTTWAVWRSLPNLHEIFVCLSTAPNVISSDDMEAIEKYIALLYQRILTLSHVNDARKLFFLEIFFGYCKIEIVLSHFVHWTSM